MNIIKELYGALSTTDRRVFWVVAIIAILLALVSMSLIPSIISSSTLLDLVGSLAPVALTIIAIVSSVSILNNRIAFGSWLFYIGIVLIALALPFIQTAVSIPVALLVMVVTVLVPLQAFSGRSTTIATVTGLLVAGTILAVDTFYTGSRAGIATQDLQVVNAAGIALALILAVSIITLYNSFNLRTKLLMLILGASFVSVIAVAGFTSTFTQNTLVEETQDSLLVAADHTAQEISDYIRFNADLISSEARLPIFTKYLTSSEEARQELVVELSRTMQGLALRDPLNIGSYALLDENGIDVWDTYRDDIGIDKSGRDYFRQPFTSGQIFISPVRFSPTSPDHGFYIGAPVLTPNGNTIVGVLRIRIRSSLLENIIKSNAGAAGEGSYAILVDEYNIILSDPTHPDFFGRTPGEIDEATIALLKAENRLLPSMDQVSLNMGQFANGLRNYTATPFFTANDGILTNESLEGVVVKLEEQPWKVAFLQPTSIALAPVERQRQIITIISLTTSVALGLITLMVSRTITVPVARLTEAAEQISSGNLQARATVRSRDELGTLADTLNLMSDQLEETLDGLEKTISERTADLEQRGQELEQRTIEMESITLRSERRASQLLAVSTVSSAIANIQNLDELLSRVTQVISTQFNFYHVGIFLNDVNNEFAILRASNSEGGQRMLARNHRLKIGQVGIVGAVSATGRPRIALDTGEDAVFFNNPDLPDTHSEMALPLRSGAKVIGALDVQSTEPNAFSDEDIEILTVLADQVSTAIQNAQLFEDSRRSAAETQLLLQQYAREQWRRVARAQKGSGYRFDGASISPLGKVKLIDGVIHIPIIVRGQTIGKLGIHAPEGRELNEDEMDIIQAVTDRLAIAAENARLLQESQERATKEQTIGEITSKIGASINLRSIMQTAVEELGQVLPGSEVTIKLETNK